MSRTPHHETPATDVAPADTKITDEHVAELAAADAGDYWWFAVRQGHVEAALRKVRDGRGPQRLLDVGCGAGGGLAALQRALRPEQSLGIDGTAAAVEIARARGVDARLVDLDRPLDLPFAPDGVTCLDVLEHLEHPVDVLRRVAATAVPGARLVVTVPAMPSLWSEWDAACGHFRRYTRAKLSQDLRAGGWTPRRVRHFFSYAVPPAWWQRVVRHRAQEVEFPPVSSLMNGLLTGAGTIERKLGACLPFGTSLLAVAERADDPPAA